MGRRRRLRMKQNPHIRVDCIANSNPTSLMSNSPTPPTPPTDELVGETVDRLRYAAGRVLDVHLQPITEFSSMPGLPGVLLPSGKAGVITRPNIVTNSYIIEILLDLLCRARGSDHARRERLYKALCAVIKQWNGPLFTPLHSFSELHNCPDSPLKKFEIFLEKVVSRVHMDTTPIIIPIIPALQLQPSGSPLTQLALTESYKHHFFDDRFMREFKLVSTLGKGSFGCVVKAENKLDGCSYAIKIIIKDKSDENNNNKILREVQALARLDHPNIVRYHSTWLQLFSVPSQYWPKGQRRRKFRRSMRRQMEEVGNDDFQKSQVQIQELMNSESSAGIVFMDSSKSKSGLVSNKISESNKVNETIEYYVSKTKTKISVGKNLKIIKKEVHVSEDCVSLSNYSKSNLGREKIFGNINALSSLENKEHPTDSEEGIAGDMESSSPNSSPVIYQSRPEMTLFIQMGLCKNTLADWITQRNSSEVQGSRLDLVKPLKCVGIFKQILLGVEYIHDKGIIHRDLKPSNIFFTEEGKVIQLGDFGLARSLQDAVHADGINSSNCINLSSIINQNSNTKDVGTPIYAPPELKIFGMYSSKSDMFNLGIILLELFSLFQTCSERIHTIGELKSKQNLDPELIQRWPDVMSWILKLTDQDQAKRPTATELLALIACYESSKVFEVKEQLHSFSSNINEEFIEQQIQLGKKEDGDQCEYFDRKLSNLKISNSEKFTSVSLTKSVTPNLEDYNNVLLENEKKDKEIKILRNENQKLQEMVAQLQERINQTSC